MKRKILALVVGFLLIGLNLFAADGDLIVNGNVGIGTATPGTNLEIYKSGGAADLGINRASNGTDYARLIFKTGSTPKWYIGLDKDSTPNVDTLGLFDPWGAGIYIKTGGNVGIGTTSPVQKFTVQGDSGGQYLAYLYNSNNMAGNEHGLLIQAGAASTDLALRITNRAATNDMMQVMGNGNVAFGIRAGNVGIGTTDPGGYKLYVSGPAYSTGGWQSSDIRFKENITAIESPLDKILNIKGVTFNWRTEEFKEKGFPEGRRHGVIAQEIEKVLPEIVKEGPGGEKSVSYTEIIPVLIEAMKEQQRILEKQQKEIEELKSSVKILKVSVGKSFANLQQ